MRQLTVILVALCLTPVALGQEVPLGDQFQVNTYIENYQNYPAIASDDLGNFVVVWLNQNGTPPWISGQRFLADGTPVGPEFQVNTLVGDELELPAVAMAGDGRFVVVWYDTGGLDGEGWSVRGQRFAADGTPVGSEMGINTFTAGNQGYPSVAMRDDGSFLVVWIGNGYHATSGINGQAFLWNGTSIWGEFGVNDHIPAGGCHRPEVSIAANGQFVVAWEAWGSPGNDQSGQSIQVRCFPWGGVVPPPQQQVNTYTGGDQNYPAVAAAPDGSFLVTYNLHYTLGIGAQRFLPDCTPIGDEFLVNSAPEEFYSPDVAVDDQGRYIVVWIYGEVFGRLFDPSGIPYDDQFWVPSHDFFGLGRPRVASSPDGQFVVTWHSHGSTGNDDDLASIQARRFAGLAGIFVDGFESGDTTAWTDMIP
jgi:hypothetical protein